MVEDSRVPGGKFLDADRFKARVRGFGADLVGIADLDPFREEQTLPSDLLAPFTRAVSVASVPPWPFSGPSRTGPARTTRPST